MRLVGKLTATFIVLLLLALTILLTLLHTQYTTAIIRYGINTLSPYAFDARHIHYTITEPWRFTVEQPKFSLGQEPPFHAEQLDMWLTPTELLSPGWAFDSILVAGLRLSPETPLPNLPAIRTNRLALTDFEIVTPELTLKEAQLQLDHWHSQPQSWGSFSGDIQLSATQARWQQVVLKNVLIDGTHSDQSWKMHGFSFDWHQANLSGQAEYLSAPDAGALLLHQLTVSGLQLQDSAQTDALKSHFKQLILPSTTIDIRRLDILDSSIELADYTINSGNLSLHNWHWPSSPWQQHDAFLSLGASTVRWKDTVLDDPLAELTFSPQQINIEGMSARLLDGYVQTDGTVTPDTLALNQLTINSIRWFLPEQWLTELTAHSRYFDNISLTSLDIGYAQLTAPHSQLPFQLSGINASGHDLVLKRRGKAGLWQGKLHASAGFASINSITMVEPFIEMNSQAGQWQLTKLLIPFRNGLLEAEATLDLHREGQPWQLALTADSMPASILPKWLRLPLPVSGAMDIGLTASGLAQHATGLAYSLDGELNGELRQLQLDKQTTAQLWQQWSQRTVSASSQHPTGKHSPLTATPLSVTADRGRITVKPVVVKGEDFAATLQGHWDLASPDKQLIQLQATQGCKVLSRDWHGDQQQLSLSPCDGNSI
ncbi:AsmA family protein [Photobacterium alginatilyticum]|uniref:AsmA family protein n=1 Tax=Photobacterium alginatilyticum TaxID=1775171 RepID=UPI004068088A